MLQIMHIVGARPNFMKAAPVFAALERRAGIAQVLIHTGQHYDKNMSDIFFAELGMPRPDINLEVGSGSHAVQTAQIMLRFEEVVLAQRPDLVLVYGDVNSTVATALVCSKLGIRTGHVEAGLRSWDRSMPEEINRLLTDQIADLLFTPSADGSENLLREGIAAAKIYLVGNTMIDTLVRLLPVAEARWPVLRQTAHIGLDGSHRFALVTLHRPANVDDPQQLGRIMQVLGQIARDIPIIFPVHPRTRQRLRKLDMRLPVANVHLVEPLGYLDFLALQRYASLVITDSGGIQEETTFLGVPCLTLRENTERPVTIIQGSNTLVGRDPERLLDETARILNASSTSAQIPPFWDGKASERIADIVQAYAG